MTPLLTTPRTDASVWLGADLRGREDWIHRMTARDIAELDTAIAHAQATGRPLFTLAREDFPLDALGERLAAMRQDIEGGRGFQLLRGLPVGRYTPDQARILAWGLSRHIGDPEPQDAKGSLMHDITDTGRKVEGSESTRGFETNDELNFHNDGGDAFLLLCLVTVWWIFKTGYRLKS